VSKFVEKIKRVYTTAAPAMGFRKPTSEEEVPPMLLLADISGSTAKRVKDLAAAGVDAFIIGSSGLDVTSFTKQIKNTGGAPLGIDLGENLPEDISEYIKAGCDFVSFSLNTKVQVVIKESLGKMLKIDVSLPPAMIKPINDLDLPVDCVVLENKNESVTVQLLLFSQLLGTMLIKPLIIESGSKISGSDLAALSKVGVKALILRNDTPPADIKELKTVIAGLPKTNKSKSAIRPSIPGISVAPEAKLEEPEEEDEEDI
jgi:hypothetical protein